MADRRRRRRRASQDSEEDDESGSGSESARSGSPSSKSRVREPEPVEAPAVRVVPKNDAESECESEDGVGEAVLSDYESADPEENGSHSEGGEDEEEGERFSDEEEARAATEPKPPAEEVPPAGEEEEEGVEEEQELEQEQGETKEVKSEEKGNLAGERQSGDGQESTDDPENQLGGKPGQKLDDDEDRKNPAYIPRKGLFFEHDVRGHAPEEERPKGRHRKLWKDEGRWEHDRFREEEQAPKSRDELVAIYGYDIRNGGGSGDRSYRQRKPRHSTSPVRDKRWRDGGERPVRTSWQGATRSAPPTMPLHPPGPQPSAPPSSQRHNTNNHPKSSPHPPPARGFQGNRPSQAHAQHRSDPRSSYKNPAETTHHRNLPGADGDRSGGPRGHSWGQQMERSPSVLVEDVRSEEDEEQASSTGVTTATTTTTTSLAQSGFHHYSNKAERDSGPASLPRRQEQQRGGGGASGTAEPPSPAGRDTSPPPERPVERKSYSLARRTRSRPAELGKQASQEDPAPAPGAGGGKGEGWQGQGPGQGQGQSQGPGQGDGPGQTGGLTGLDQDLARLSLAGQNWGPNPHSYLRAEMRGIPNTMHVGGAPPQYPNMEEMGVGANRAKRYSSQRQRAGPEPAPLHIGVMEGHYYEPMSYQGPIYAHGDNPAPLPPQGMLVQPEMHLPHPGHPGHPGLHQSGAPMPSPGLYAAPPVSMSPGQPPPQQLLAPPFYPPPGVMTFSNTNYPFPAGASLPPLFNPQSQVYGGVTYYDTVQQQAQPKPSPPRRSSQPVTIKPPPPEMAFAPE